MIEENVDLLEQAAKSIPDRRTSVNELKRLVKKKMSFVKETIEARNQSYETADAMVKSGAMKEILGSTVNIRKTTIDIHGIETAAPGNHLNTIQYALTGCLLVPGIVVILFYTINSNLAKQEDATATSMMKQVCCNLISSCLKYSGKTGNPAVEIASFSSNNNVCYYVHDNGVGINVPYVDRLFGRFQRLHKHDEWEGGKRIVDRREARVWAEGAINERAKFFFSLPS